MKTISWICWLLAVCICLSDAKSKIRRPLPPSYALVLKKPRPISHRISMGNTIHIGGNFPQRVPYKQQLQVNYRVRRPVYNVLPIGWKNQVPIRATLNNRAVLPQRAPVKEFHSVNKMPEYSPEYRPELVVLPATHRGSIDDDKGPIHTIPAPNLSPADKPYNSANDLKDIADRRPYSSDLNYHATAQNSNIVTNVGLAAIGNGLSAQKTATNPSTPQHQYEVTESNDATVLKDHQVAVQSATIQPQDLDVTRLYSTIVNPHPQSNELFVNHPVNGPSVMQFGQSSAPMQTNLHSSLHVGFPATAVQPYTVTQQIPELHVGHPAPAGPPLSATQLYDLLNNFPHKLTEQYTPDQQHILQQQLDQILQPDTITSFSQPQMHSFNYDEQANQQQQANQLQQQQQQQQQILLDQDYATGSVTADYNLDPESSIDARKQNNNLRAKEELTYPVDGVEQSENNIEYEGASHQRSPTPYSKRTGNVGGAIATKFYTTLPNREAAEKLAALAAAGNVNSRLIGQLRKQQQENVQSNESMPSNHKNDDNASQRTRTDGDQLQKYDQYKYHRNQQQRRKPSYKVQNDEKLPLQITVPEEDEYVVDDQLSDIKKDNVDMEYEYEGEDGEVEESQESAASFDGEITPQDNDPHAEFGSRLRSKTRE
ncbi:alpha-protein kinase 1-like isoform X2 [Odontomachus brunneus]|uniref:alpha-protein kinase 1-like isoform X2 n=1 Tax=Odontomachus brunneus TaxID=486640 RepID=UPI0013F243FE|nr:alpha-protein kinase 1-like isoform X2 [Odontomachus brunneus]